MRKSLFLFLALLSTIGAWADPVSSVSQLSNSKCYTVVTERGAWWADLTNNKPSYQASITTPANVPNQDAYKFAIIKQGESFFLYSLAAQKFIHPRYNFVTMMPTPLTIEDMGNSKMKMMSSNPNKAVNIGGGQWTWDTWTTTDGGNLLTISEVGDFDPTAALAMLTTTQVYTVSCDRGSWAVTSEKLTGNGASGILTNQQFALFVNEGKMYLYSVGAEKFVKSDGSLFGGKGDPITFNLTGDTSYPYQFYFPLATQIYFNMQGGGSNIIFNDYSSADPGNKCQITSVTDADVAAITAKATEVFFGSKTITYNIKINGTTVATTTNEQKVGAAAELPSEYASKEYVTYSYSPTTIGVDTEEVEVTATVGTLPFEVSSDFDNAHWYNIKIGANQRYVAWEDSEPYHTHAEDEATENARAHAPYQWAFMGNPVTGIKVVNRHLGASYSLTSEGTGANVNGTTGIPNTVLRSGDHYWDIHQNNDGFSLNLIGKNNYYINTHGGPNGYFQIWQSSGAKTDGGSRINVAEVPDLATTVTYNVTYGGSVAYTSTVPGVIGEELGALPYDVDLDYVTITGHDASAIITRDMVVNVTATWNGPFELSADYASAHWYDMAVRGNYYVTSDNKDVTNALAPIPANAMGLAEDAYQWAFVGNPYNIKLYNKAEGSTKVYAWTSNENSSIPAFVDAASGNCWWIKQSTSSISNAFLLTIPHDGYQVNQFGGSSGSLKIWNSTGTGDLGSAFTVFDVPDNFAEYATAEIKPYAAPTGYFALTDAAKASIGWQDSYETTCPYETYRDMKLALQAIDLTDMSNFNFPETGYYTLKNNARGGTYMGIDPSDANMYGNYATAVAAKQIVKLTKTGTGTYTIGLMGKFAPATVSQSTQVTATAVAGTYTVSVPTVGYAAFSANPSEQYAALHCASGGSIVGWTNDAAASQWIVEDATSIELAIGAEGYATTYLPFPVTAPDGVTVYTGKVNGDYLTLTELTSTIPAKNGVVLKAAPETYTFTVAAEAANLENNDLKGTLEPIAATGKYVLAKPAGEEVGFYLANSGDIAAGKAYLEINSEIKGFIFKFDDDATGIDDISDYNNAKNLNESKAIYNLAGQRLNKMQKGINIVNGKKIMVK